MNRSRALGLIDLKNVPLSTRIFIFYAAILLASLTIFAVLTIKISNEAIVEKATKNAGRELALINKSLLNLTQNVEDYVRILSCDNRLQRQLEYVRKSKVTSLDKLKAEKELSTVISNVVTPTSNIAAASILTTDRKLFEIGYIDNSSVYPLFDSNIINTQSKTPVWSGLINVKYKTAGDDNVFAISKTIIGLDTGYILGTAVLYLNEEIIASIYLNNMVNKDDKFFIIDDKENIISSYDKKELFQKFNEEKYLGVEKLAEILDTKSLIRNIGNKQALITVQNFNKLHWKIVSVVPLDEITYENKGLTKLIIILGVLCLICAFIASYLLSITISKPILKLVRIMKEIKSGNLKLRADFKAKDEIGMLGDGFNSLMDKINSLLNQIYHEQKIKQENEFRLLQSQIKPHFLYNTIETIISFIKLGMKDNAMLTAKNLAGFYRISLSKGKDIISIEEEMILIDNYLSIQKLRYVEYLDYHLDFEKKILNYQIPKLTLQPLVENAIYHGLKQKDEKGYLTIRGHCNNDLIIIEVIDDGVGMTEEQIRRVLKQPSENQKNTDFGLYNVDTRLKLLYGEQYGITIESRVAEYTKVIVKLPAVALLR